MCPPFPVKRYKAFVEMWSFLRGLKSQVFLPGLPTICDNTRSMFTSFLLHVSHSDYVAVGDMNPLYNIPD